MAARFNIVILSFLLDLFRDRGTKSCEKLRHIEIGVKVQEAMVAFSYDSSYLRR